MYDFQGLNYHKFKDLIDVVSWDNYPTWHKEAEEVTALDAALQHDFMRRFDEKPFPSDGVPADKHELAECQQARNGLGF